MSYVLAFSLAVIINGNVQIKETTYLPYHFQTKELCNQAKEGFEGSEANLNCLVINKVSK